MKQESPFVYMLPPDQMHRYYSRKFILADHDVAEQIDKWLNSFHQSGITWDGMYNWRVIGYVQGLAGEIVITVHVYDGRSHKEPLQGGEGGVLAPLP